ncbi:Uncharacterised protein [BD1-7 clade bacterium]|uniref:YicC family protein n=1 Tax=BD1-7 clade bacterium TaxID=2029982 RepID=A0A5S9MXC4_9GAMM|nr:Uncharacterised protein [BD1-7 clade bacterium]CAA0082732.1 Uncharacterised protein [BD1-7 clade bacterium]
MTLSMTAFARVEHQAPWGTLTWELRSVNHRYLEPTFKMPDFARSHEHLLREKLRKTLVRGKVECGLRFEKNTAEAQSISINNELLEALLNANQQVADKLPASAPEAASTFLQWPGIITTAGIDAEELQKAILESFEAALSQLVEYRTREGAELKNIIELRLTRIQEINQSVKSWLPEIIQNQRQKLLNRFADMQLDIDNDRVEQELVIIAQKIDVDEELDRLQTHLKEVQKTLNKGSPCGRRLDFLMQELNREANTLGSKSISAEQSQASVDLKVCIEQMREQIQNIE